MERVQTRKRLLIVANLSQRGATREGTYLEREDSRRDQRDDRKIINWTANSGGTKKSKERSAVEQIRKMVRRPTFTECC